jgi:hypothetical protein
MKSTVMFPVIYVHKELSLSERGTALQAEMPRIRLPVVYLELFIDVILPAALWPLTEINARNISWGVKAAGRRTDNLTTFVSIVLKSGSLNLLEPSGRVIGLYMDFLIFTCLYLYLHLTFIEEYSFIHVLHVDDVISGEILHNCVKLM